MAKLTPRSRSIKSNRPAIGLRSSGTYVQHCRAWIVCIVDFLWASEILPSRQITRLRSVNGGIRKHGMSKHWRAVKLMQPRRDKAVVASQRLARNEVSNTRVAVSSQPLTNDVSELGGSKRRIQVGRRRSNRRREHLRQQCRR